MPKFKVPLQKYIIQVGEVLVLLTSHTSYHGQGIYSAVYDIVSIHHGTVGCLFIVIGDRHLSRELEERLVQVHGEGVL